MLSHFSFLRKQKSLKTERALCFFSRELFFRIRVGDFYANIFAISLSASVICCKPKVSEITFATLGERNPGKVGPKIIFLNPKESKARRTATAFCSYQARSKERGSLFTSSKPNASFSFKAITASE